MLFSCPAAGKMLGSTGFSKKNGPPIWANETITPKPQCIGHFGGRKPEAFWDISKKAGIGRDEKIVINYTPEV